MRIRRLEIKNFRGLKEIELQTDKRVNVIVGPNAVGKTTVIEAIRLAKGALSPRYMQEGQQVMQSLGALSPHFQFLGVQGFDFSAIANDESKDLEVNIDFDLSDQEVSILRGNSEQLALAVLQSRIARNDEGGQFQLTQFLSSQEGVAALESAREGANAALSTLAAGKAVSIKLKVIAGTNTFTGNDIYGQLAIATLERALAPQYAKFSYFPADRAFPQGEIAIQLGSADAQNQVQAHLGTPSAKYGRLKIALAQSVLLGNLKQDELAAEFGDVLDALLPGKKFTSITMNEIGVMKLLVQDIGSQKTFDVDNMSSGEKGLLSIFLLSNLSMAPGGILMLDEPELHLNPAVTRNMLSYICRKAAEKDLQVFLCTHSPEILSDAYEYDDCGLFHLRSGTDLTPVYRQDSAEVLEILDRLGASTADVLFSKGNIFVEGEHDEEILGAGWGEIIGGYKVTRLGGRSEVEKAIRNLQASPGPVGKVKLFLFDHDRRPTGLSGSGEVIVKQWGRYCLENYLLDDKPLYDVVSELATTKPASRGEFLRNLRDDALAQVDGYVVRRVYANLEPENPGLRPSEIKGKDIATSAEVLADRLQAIATDMAAFDAIQWRQSFTEQAEVMKATLLSEWDTSWRAEADGKALIDELYRRYGIRLDKLSFKKRVARAVRLEESEAWRTVAGILRDALIVGS